MNAIGRVVVALGVSAALGGCLISPVIRFGGSGKSSSELEHDSLSKLLPAVLEAPGGWRGAPRVAVIRVWADDDYRAQNLHWQRGFDEQLAYANHVLTPMLGLRLEAEYRIWPHHAPGSPLGAELEAIAARDPGEDVAFVVGLTSSLGLVAATFEQIGIAELGGRHLVVRGHADAEERAAFERAFPKLERDERDSVLEARRRHKTTATLLHEIAHALGALHETEIDAVMSANYSHRSAAIGERNRELMLIALGDRLAPPAEREPRAAAQAMLGALERDGGDWDSAERRARASELHDRLGAAPVSVAVEGIPAAIRNQYRLAEHMLASGDTGRASSVVESLLASYPDNARLAALRCRIEQTRAGTGDAAAICERAAARAAELAPLGAESARR
jgi:hypothetical protein